MPCLTHVNMESGALLDAKTNDTPVLTDEQFVEVYNEALGQIIRLKELTMGPIGTVFAV